VCVCVWGGVVVRVQYIHIGVRLTSNTHVSTIILIHMAHFDKRCSHIQEIADSFLNMQITAFFEC